MNVTQPDRAAHHEREAARAYDRAYALSLRADSAEFRGDAEEAERLRAQVRAWRRHAAQLLVRGAE